MTFNSFEDETHAQIWGMREFDQPSFNSFEDETLLASLSILLHICSFNSFEDETIMAEVTKALERANFQFLWGWNT